MTTTSSSSFTDEELKVILGATRFDEMIATREKNLKRPAAKVAWKAFWASVTWEFTTTVADPKEHGKVWWREHEVTTFVDIVRKPSQPSIDEHTRLLKEYGSATPLDDHASGTVAIWHNQVVGHVGGGWMLCQPLSDSGFFMRDGAKATMERSLRRIRHIEEALHDSRLSQPGDSITWTETGNNNIP